MDHWVSNVCYAPLWEAILQVARVEQGDKNPCVLTRVEHSTTFQAHGRKAVRKEARVAGQVPKSLFSCPVFGPIPLSSYMHDP